MRLLWIALTLSLWALPARAVSPEDLMQGVGEGPSAHLSMLFEVTFMRIDVATIDVFLSDSLAGRIAEVVAGAEYGKETRKRIETLLLTADPVLMRMTFARNAGWNKFVNGAKKNLEHAVEANLLTSDEFDAVWPPLEGRLAVLNERGVKKGDAVYYRIDGNRIQTVYFDPKGKALFDFTENSEPRTRGTRGGFLCKKSKFHKKLIKSLFETE